ncbi:hypothetical protein J5N97_016151 [Dioscorea zingiberensis]|uniref:Bifunctional inhibitor/plant lipid transfer protein/seed storage helical domain-containing protein n=1 Tax=Dioscorea zingiberensis TaxID=325984 RepID=A0A9D5CJ42_9LILI|nr:hypothetical protein J5N97_016151 [Dioscorea zingiberensis]
MAISSSLLNFSMLLVLGFIGAARSDFASDRAECTDQLVGLASCLSFVQSTDIETPTPMPDCCSDFKGVVGKSFKCLCVLIKDRDEPQLGIKVNVTRALMLPAKCNAPVNVTDCPRLLKVPLNSSEAKDFKQFADEIQGIGKSAQEELGSHSLAMATSSSLLHSNLIQFILIFFSFVVNLTLSDFAGDQSECGEQLVGLAGCLPYVQGSAKAPTPDCCTGLKEVLEKSPKCLCVLIKDRDDPQLGLEINVTLAVSLPSACATHANISECPS